jgi:hypothetical protein
MGGFPPASASPFVSGGGSGASSLHNVSRTILVVGHGLTHQVSLEKLTARLINNQDRRIELMEKREKIRDGGNDDEEDDDPVIIQGQM